MDYKVIKKSDENYKRLLRESAFLESDNGKKVSMNDTTYHLRKKIKK